MKSQYGIPEKLATDFTGSKRFQPKSTVFNDFRFCIVRRFTVRHMTGKPPDSNLLTA